MNDILMCAGAVGVYLGLLALRGVFGYIKNTKKYEEIKFDWKKFLKGSIKPILLTLSISALAALILAFLKLVDASGVQIEGLDQISTQSLLIGLFIADVTAFGYTISEALKLFGLTDKEVAQIRETVAKEGDTGIAIGVDENGNLIASAETITPKSDKELLDEEGTDVDHGEELDVEEGGKGAAWVNTYPEPYRSAPKDSKLDPSTCYNRECVSYCAWKICEAMGKWPPRTGDMNAKNWIYRLPSWGYKQVSAPKNGGLYVGVLTSGKYGHVVWFEGGNTISEYNYGSTGNYGVRNINLSQYIWYEIKAPAPAPTPTPTTDFKVGDNVTLKSYVDYYGNKLIKTRDYYTISEISGDRAVLVSGGVVYAAVNTNNLVKYNGSTTPTSNAPKIGDRVYTSATKDQNGTYLNLKIINDGNSIWTENNGRGMAVLRTANGTCRCAVAPSSLRKA